MKLPERSFDDDELTPLDKEFDKGEHKDQEIEDQL